MCLGASLWTATEKEKQRRQNRNRYLKLTDYCGFKNKAVNRRQDDKVKGQELSRAAKQSSAQEAPAKGWKQKLPCLIYIYVQSKSQNQTVKDEIDDAWSFRVQLGRLQMPDCWLWCCITALPHRDSGEDKKRIELRAAPYFYILFLSFSMVVFFLPQRNCKTKGCTQKIWGYRILSGRNRKKESIEVFDSKCQETIEALFFKESKQETLMLAVAFETNSQKLQY